MSEKNEKFDEILLELLEQEEKKIFSDVGSIDQRIADVYNEHHSRESVFDEVYLNEDGTERIKSDVDEKIASKASFAASLGMKIALNLCVAHDLKAAIDARFANTPNKELGKQLKEYVAQKLEYRGNTKEERIFVGTVNLLFDKHISANGTTREFLRQSREAFEAVNLVTHGLREDMKRFMDDAPRVIDNTFSLKEALFEADRIYAGELKNTVIAPIDYRFTFDGSDETYDPTDFLESYNKQKAFEERDHKKLVEEKRQILKNRRSSINDVIIKSINDFYDNWDKCSRELREQNRKRHLRDEVLTKESIASMNDMQVERCFSAFCDEEQLKGYHKTSVKDYVFSEIMFRNIVESLEEHFDLPKREDGPYTVGDKNFLIDNKRAQSSEDIVAGILSGKKVECDFFPGKTVTIMPNLYLSAKPLAKDEKSGIMQFFSELWESIKSIFDRSENDKERKIAEKANKMDETIQQSLAESHSRHKITFTEMVDDSFSKKLVAPEKREEIKNKQLEKTPEKK